MKNFPQLIVIHTVKGFGIVDKAEIYTSGVTGKLGLGVRNEARQRPIEFCQENALVIAKNLFQQHNRGLYIWTSQDGQS